MKLVLSFLLFWTLAVATHAQELNAKVVVNSSKIEGTNKKACEALAQKLQDFLAQKQWTSLQYGEQERIECTLNITVNKYTSQDGGFECTLLLSAGRPVWGSAYNSVLYSTRDQHFNFRFDPADQLEYNPDNIDNQLVALLAYYAHLLIGMDLDSFSPLGGTSILQAAEDIVNKAQNLGYSGWSAFNESNNRFGLLNDYMDGSMEAVRQFNYVYHRRGLDQLADSAEQALSAITESMELLEQARQGRTMSSVPQLITEYKREELINVLSTLPQEEDRQRAYDILFAIDPSQSSKWEKIKK